MTITVARESEDGLKLQEWRFVVSLERELVLSFRRFRESGRNDPAEEWRELSIWQFPDMQNVSTMKQADCPADVTTEAKQILLHRITLDI